MASRDPVGAERLCALEEGVEFDEGVAVEARIGRAAVGVLVDELIHDELPEGTLQVECVVRNTEPLRDAAGVANVLDGAALAAAGVVLGTGLGPQTHRDPDHVVALLDQQRGGGRGVDSAAHADHDSLSHERYH